MTTYLAPALVVGNDLKDYFLDALDY